MNEQTVTGICTEIAQKPGVEWVEFHIDGGGKYPVKLSTKQLPLIELGRAVGGQLATWTYKETDGNPNPHKPGEFYKNRWLESVEVGGTQNPTGSVATPAAVASGGLIGPAVLPSWEKPTSEGMSKDEWARKDSAIHKMACIKTAAAALTHTMPSDPTPEDLRTFIERVKSLSYQWLQEVEAVRKGDDSDIPFLTAHDQEIPYA